jgi:hypothetical protein
MVILSNCKHINQSGKVVQIQSVIEQNIENVPLTLLLEPMAAM